MTRLLTLKQAAEYLHLHPETVRRCTSCKSWAAGRQRRWCSAMRIYRVRICWLIRRVSIHQQRLIPLFVVKSFDTVSAAG